MTSEELNQSLTSLQELLDTLQVASADVGELARQLKQETTEFSSNSAETMGKIGQLTQSMDHSFARLSELLNEDSPQLQKINSTLDEISQAARVISELKDAPERYRLEKALKELQSAARSFRQLNEAIEKNPGSLIWGRKPEKTK